MSQQPGVYRPVVQYPAAAGYVGIAAPSSAGNELQGSSPNLQGSAPILQGSGNGGAPAVVTPPTPVVKPIDNTAGINGLYNGVYQGYDSQQNDLNRVLGVNQAQVGAQYNTNRAGIDSSFNTGGENLDRGQAGVDFARASGLRDLGNNMQAAIRSRMAGIGNAGSGSSSAGYQLADAMHNVQNDSRVGLIDQAGQQYGDIALQRTQLGRSHDEALKQLDDWKSGQIAQIVSDYQTKTNQINIGRAGADAGKQAAVAANSLALAQSSAAALANVQTQYQTALTSAGTGGNAIGASFQPTLAGYNYTPQGLTGADPLVNYQGATQPSGSSTPMYYSTKKNQPYA